MFHAASFKTDLRRRKKIAFNSFGKHLATGGGQQPLGNDPSPGYREFPRSRFLEP